MRPQKVFGSLRVPRATRPCAWKASTQLHHDRCGTRFGGPDRSAGPVVPGDAAACQSAMLLSEEEELLVTSRLHQILRPFMLRRMKDSVAIPMPDKVVWGLGGWALLRC